MITGDQILCHLFGDYILQTDYMAMHKRNKFKVAILHGLFYSFPFLFVCLNPFKLLLIAIIHAVMDHYGLARYLCFIKEYITPTETKDWTDYCITGYHRDRPMWLTTWLMIICDNTMHILINGLIIKYL